MEILYLIIFFILGSIVGTISTILGLRIPKKEKLLGNKLHCLMLLFNHIVRECFEVDAFSLLLQFLPNQERE